MDTSLLEALGMNKNMSSKIIIYVDKLLLKLIYMIETAIYDTKIFPTPQYIWSCYLLNSVNVLKLTAETREPAPSLWK